MAKRLELETLRADLAAVTGLLARRTPERDPVGYFQFDQRREMLEQQIRELGQVDEPLAEVGLFFAGRPVIGSRGITADFSTKALGSFQSVVSARYAADSGPIGQRGRVRHRDRSQLIIKDVVRGSFGFVLEEVENEVGGAPSLKPALDDAVAIIYSAAKGAQAEFNDATDAQDPKVLDSVKSFFAFLDEQGASVRVVEGDRDFTISREEITRARARTDNLDVRENNQDFVGILYLLPDARRFELHDQRGEPTKKGPISRECFDTLVTPEGSVREGVAGSLQTATLRVRRTTMRNGEERVSYALIATRPISPAGGQGEA
ncbi:hypothetical protein [Methylobacterium radiotolerans]|uniref:hypothetical protein n=1 Tax=Methylobacterium radiotolerans TaxID=31998 RepID=UPI001F1C9474|nr:hypothetical protein [Methylobacterium radiotolerans]UIY45765.1 hypothetical protein LZ599_32225 [Methylobacterium radiotolerans]